MALPARISRKRKAPSEDEQTDDESGTETTHNRKRPKPSQQPQSSTQEYTFSSPNSAPFQKGAIRKIRVHNWVTFSDVDLSPQPGLNLVMGPNGSGKSSLVGAIALGLGANPKSLARGDSVTEFIKRGCDNGYIEIELHEAGKNGQHCRIKRVVHGGKSLWTINDRRKSKQEIDDFVKSLNIKTDNLCQFLAQDRVSEFANLSAKELLIETEKAIADAALFNWHNQLITMTNHKSEDEKYLKDMERDLEAALNQKARNAQVMDRFQSRQKYEKRMRVYQAKKEWRIVDEMESTVAGLQIEVGALRRQYKDALKSVQPLKNDVRKWQNEMRKAKAKVDSLSRDIAKLDESRAQHTNVIGRAARTIEKEEQKINEAKDEEKDRKRKIARLRSDIERMQNELQSLPPQNELRSEQQRITAEISAARSEQDSIKYEKEDLGRKRRRFINERTTLYSEIEHFKNRALQRDKCIFYKHRSKDRKFLSWVESSRHLFQAQVCGPIIREMDVKDAQLAQYLNNRIGEAHYFAYVASNRHDWDLLTREAKTMGLSIMIIEQPTDDDILNRRQANIDDLRQSGVEGYLDQAFEAKSVVKYALANMCRLSTVGYTKRALHPNELTAVLRQHKDDRNVLNSLMTPDVSWNVTVSRYDGSASQVSQPLRQNQGWLRVTPDVQSDIDSRKERIGVIDAELDAIDKQNRDAQTREAPVLRRLNDAKKPLNDVKRKLLLHRNGSAKLTTKQTDLQRCESTSVDIERVKQRYREAVKKWSDQRVSAIEQICQIMQRTVTTFQKRNAQLFKQKQSELELNALAALVRSEERKNESLAKRKKTSEVRLKEKSRKLRTKREDVERDYPQLKYTEQWREGITEEWLRDEWDSSKLEQEIRNCEGRLQCIFVSEEELSNYRKLEARINKLSSELAKITNENSDRDERMKEILEQWEPQLRAAVAEISKAFTAFIREIKADGYIELKRDETQPLNYNEWSIHIMVKFRSNEPLKRLSSHSHSGGEKSLSTMLYLLSLQNVTTVPFRVVDEINQGMDPINERKIMQILNRVCTPTNGGTSIPQYFVVTPKLLPNLQYTGEATVFIVYNGPFQTPQLAWNEMIASQIERASQLSQN